ncbi:hypothetical protein AB0C02_01645 [Micromonospora sp. NPDC048999]|uniref:hypothetical protein n=1 Tax=Micromonospora sp. NPDC048999 TaxID=3155391 RepID=UPI0033C883AF
MSLTPPSSYPVRQPSLFSTEAADPSLADLAGLLAGPGEVVRMGGTARLAVVVGAAWRVHVLVAELGARGVAASWEPTGDGRHLVRTAYATTLAPLATAWLRGTAKQAPAGFHLDGRRLRLWLAAAGVVDPAGVQLGLGPADEEGRSRVRAALAAVGLPAAFVEPDAGGPAYRVTGRRVARLAELVGDRPKAAPTAEWPGAG